MKLQIARMGIEQGKRGIRFAKTLQFDFFPQLVQPSTGELYVSRPCYQHSPEMKTL